MEHGEINVAVEAYLRAYMQPPLTAEQIYLGQQNNSALPKTREHVVFFLPVPAESVRTSGNRL